MSEDKDVVCENVNIKILGVGMAARLLEEMIATFEVSITRGNDFCFQEAKRNLEAIFHSLINAANAQREMLNEERAQEREAFKPLTSLLGGNDDEESEKAVQ